LWAVFALILMTAVGIAAYFVPLDKFILTEQELAQKKILEEQNASLRRNIGTTLKTLSSLTERTERLWDQKERHVDIIGLSQKTPTRAAPQQKTAARSPSSLSHIGESEEIIARFVSAASEGNGKFFDAIPVLHPVAPGHYVISRRYGMDLDPFTGKQKMHYGLDFAAELGTPVVATMSGTVSRVENNPIWGRRVTITHGRDFRTVYAHLGTVRVPMGKTVRRGEIIGTVGVSSGMTTGMHVHYEIWHEDKPVNPETFLFPITVAAR
jgi:murein DD-endopeptidase MepM/ murein hydrolase activator NlpD